MFSEIETRRIIYLNVLAKAIEKPFMNCRHDSKGTNKYNITIILHILQCMRQCKLDVKKPLEVSLMIVFHSTLANTSDHLGFSKLVVMSYVFVCLSFLPLSSSTSTLHLGISVVPLVNARRLIVEFPTA